MKKYMFFCLGIIVHFSIMSQDEASQASGIPEGTLKTLNGADFSSEEMSNGGNPFLIFFWKSCCKSNLTFMDAMHDIYSDLVDDYNIKVYAISIDDSRSSANIKPYVNGKGWEFDVLLDVNGDLKRAMNVNLTPHYMLFDGNRRMVWKKVGFVEGDEYEVEEVLSKLENGESIE